jgi:hypothetical protein
MTTATSMPSTRAAQPCVVSPSTYASFVTAVAMWFPTRRYAKQQEQGVATGSCARWICHRCNGRNAMVAPRLRRGWEVRGEPELELGDENARGYRSQDNECRSDVLNLPLPRVPVDPAIKEREPSSEFRKGRAGAPDQVIARESLIRRRLRLPVHPNTPRYGMSCPPSQQGCPGMRGESQHVRSSWLEGLPSVSYPFGCAAKPVSTGL